MAGAEEEHLMWIIRKVEKDIVEGALGWPGLYEEYPELMNQKRMQASRRVLMDRLLDLNDERQEMLAMLEERVAKQSKRVPKRSASVSSSFDEGEPATKRYADSNDSLLDGSPTNVEDIVKHF